MMTLRNYIIFLLTTFVFTTTSFGQTKSEQIKAIREEFQVINSDTTFKKVTLENDEFLDNMTDGAGELTGYFKGEQIKKIYQWVGLSNGNEIMEFYFKDEQLIFVYEKFNSFVYDKKKEQLDLTKTETTFEGRYYFNNKKLIDNITTGHNRFEDDTIDPEKTLLTKADDNLKLLNREK